MQRAVEDGFQAFGYNGAAVMLDPTNGEVLAFTSLPAYDPNAFAAGIDRATWAALNTDELRPLHDRAIQGRYSPGSTFKMAVATAALEEGVITPDFKVHCGGAGVFYGRAFKCWKTGGHGTVDLRHAIEQSCNVYFYTRRQHDRHRPDPQVGDAARPRREERHRPAERSRRDRAVDRSGSGGGPGEKWYAGETISVSIGQGQVSVTPISMAVMMATLANGGTRVDAPSAQGGRRWHAGGSRCRRRRRSRRSR